MASSNWTGRCWASPSNRFIVDNLESLADKPGSTLHEATVDFYQRSYSANIMKLAMVSPLPLAEMRIMARTWATAPSCNSALRNSWATPRAAWAARWGISASERRAQRNQAAATESAAPFLQDWNRERYNFDSRAQLLAAVDNTALADIQRFYRDSVIAVDTAAC